MDKITISSSTGIYTKVNDEGDLNVTIEVEDLTKVSDGYHTIEELYEHRHLLYLLYVISQIGNYDDIYYKEEDYPGWFILYIEITEGQISYHLPNKYLKIVKAQGIKKAPDDYKWDGHTSKDVLERLDHELERRNK